MNEIWKSIPNYPDYEVSNFGNVKSYKGKIPKLLKINYYPNGYTFVSLRHNNKNKNFLIHRLVLSAFNPQENEEELQANHINCVRDDNRLDNLEWVTPQQNRNYREQLHHTPKSQKILVKFLDDREDMIFHTMTECANYFGLTRKAINNYLRSKTIRSDRKVQAYFYRID
jgi:hypothetical protein